MDIPGITITDPQALREWLDSEEHSYRCTAWDDEGLWCGLDKLLGDDRLSPDEVD